MRFDIKSLFFLLFTFSLYASIDNGRYKTNFGYCPKAIVGKMSLELSQRFEKYKSLADLKKYIIDQKIDKRHFISFYKIDYDPVTKLLDLNFDCPKAQAKVQIYKDDGSELYNAILVETGAAVDPHYEVLLRAEQKLIGSLPFLSVTYKELEKNFLKKISNYLKNLDPEFKDMVSEIIIDKKSNLSLILKTKYGVVSTFVGQGEWQKKTTRLIKAVRYFEEQKKIPSIIKFSDVKKIIVKFPQTL